MIQIYNYFLKPYHLFTVVSLSEKRVSAGMGIVNSVPYLDIEDLMFDTKGGD